LIASRSELGDRAIATKLEDRGVRVDDDSLGLEGAGAVPRGTAVDVAASTDTSRNRHANIRRLLDNSLPFDKDLKHGIEDNQVANRCGTT